jgi:large subunit ribosomal protein L14e
LYKRLVQVGRVVVIAYGPDAGKLAVITDIIDHNRAIIDGPTTGVARQQLSFKRMTLTPLLVQLPRGSRSKIVKKALSKSGTEEEWKKSTWSKKLQAREAKAASSDFDRFKAQQAKKQRKTLVAKAGKKPAAAKKTAKK